MLLTHKLEQFQIDELNKKLVDHYGRSFLGKPNFRVVWSDDQYEKRVTEYSDKGVLLLRPEVRELPKYKPMIKERYLLERLAFVPDGVKTDLVENYSYEILWNFQSNKGYPLVPVWGAIYFIIENLLESMRLSGYVRYKDPEATPEEAEEVKKLRYEAIMEALYGNETDLTDSLHAKEGIVVPRSLES